MQRASRSVISGWRAALLAPVALPIALFAGLLSRGKTVDRTPAAVASFLRDFVNGTAGEWDWDEFESLRITDPRLEAIRLRAAQFAPPNPDLDGLRALAAEVEALRPPP